MSAEFWAGYLSGAAGIVVGNPLDLLKTRLQAGPDAALARGHFDRVGTLVRGAPAPILGYGALNALLFATYTRSLALLAPPPTPTSSSTSPDTAPLAAVYAAGALGGLATFVVSAPTELVKCRAQVWASSNGPSAGGSLPRRDAVGTRERATSLGVARDVWRREGVMGFFRGGGVTSVRDAVGYGFYFWTYELCKRSTWPFSFPSSPTSTVSSASSPSPIHTADDPSTLRILLSGGIAGVATWVSVFPLDVLKTRIQTATTTSLPPNGRRQTTTAWALARRIYRAEGPRAFVRGLGVCSARAFGVNAVQWGVYEWAVGVLRRASV